MSREYGYQSEVQEPILWDRVEWRQGDGHYVFEVARGLLATLSSPHGNNLTLPMVAWEGLLDALAAARKTKSRAERNLPSRTGARWSEGETQELVKTFKAGGSIAQLARVHNRTQFAVEAQLERQGLWDRAERRPTARVIGGDAGSPRHGCGQPIAAASVDGEAMTRMGGPSQPRPLMANPLGLLWLPRARGLTTQDNRLRSVQWMHAHPSLRRLPAAGAMIMGRSPHSTRRRQFGLLLQRLPSADAMTQASSLHLSTRMRTRHLPAPWRQALPVRTATVIRCEGYADVSPGACRRQAPTAG